MTMQISSRTKKLLPAVVNAVAGRVPVLVDGGIRRGTDVLKAIATGATAVGLGRSQGWARAAGGAPVLLRALEIMEAEIRNTMGLIGAAKLSDLDPSFVREARAVDRANELSAFPFLAEEIRGPA